MRFDNRVTRLLGIDIPIFQAPMGYVAKPPLVAAVSEAGAMGLVPGRSGPTSSATTSAAPAS